MLYKWNHIQYVTFWDWQFSLSVTPLRSVWVVSCIPGLFLFRYWVVFHGTDVPWFVYPFTHWSRLGCLQIKLLWIFACTTVWIPDSPFQTKSYAELWDEAVNKVVLWLKQGGRPRTYLLGFSFAPASPHGSQKHSLKTIALGSPSSQTMEVFLGLSRLQDVRTWASLFPYLCGAQLCCTKESPRRIKNPQAQPHPTPTNRDPLGWGTGIWCL